ncbi:MAG TPA: DUF3300 domain-containing protein [Bryobacteraceae bacterium]|nr:DUF3300 domain-containing protein [Bryobacteraceae bacterium]
MDSLVAPIALYPDALLSQILVASTYPLEIVEAGQWVQQNQGLQGQALLDAARQQNWDASVQALVVFPDVVSRLNSNIRWTTDLGNAFLAQQADVMSAVQRLRAQAQAAGRLSSNPQETIGTTTQDGQTAIQIQPTNPDVMYVPQYNPVDVWGPAPYGYYYPDLYYPTYGWGFGFFPPIYIGGFFGGWGGWGGWGWGCNWFGGSLFVNAGFFHHYGFHDFGGRGFYGRGFGGRGFDGRGFGGRGFDGRQTWSHNPEHRMGVAYPNQTVANRFGGSFAGRGRVGSARAAAENRGAFGNRGFAGSSNFANRGSSFANRGNSNFGNRGSSLPDRGSAFANRGSSFANRGGFSNNTPRATAPRSNQFGAGNFRSSGLAQSYRAPSAQSYRSPAFGGSNQFRSAPAFRSAPSFNRSAPAFRSAPSFHSAPSFSSRGFSGHSSAPSFHSSGGGFHGGGGGGFHGGGGGSHGGRR